jgi:hypothetical protein
LVDRSRRVERLRTLQRQTATSPHVQRLAVVQRSLNDDNNRPETVAQRELAGLIDRSRRVERLRNLQTQIANSPLVQSLPVVQRKLDDEDKRRLLTYAKEILNTPELDEAAARYVNGLVAFSSDLASAMRDLRQKYTGMQVKKMMPDTRTNTLGVWLKDEESLFTAAKAVGMTAGVATNSGRKDFILWTQSLKGCLGVAGTNGANAFLAHWIPSQLKDDVLEDRMEELDSKLGGAGKICISSPMKDAPYVAAFKKKLADHGGYEITREEADERLAINSRTGEIMVNFRVDDLLGD